MRSEVQVAQFTDMSIALQNEQYKIMIRTLAVIVPGNNPRSSSVCCRWCAEVASGSHYMVATVITKALLVTVVREKNEEGHAVLTVITDKGDYVLDNQNEDILIWSETGYRFVKRQSQSDSKVWVSLDDKLGPREMSRL